MRRDLPELIHHANELGLRSLLGTNATLITEDYARTLKKAGLKQVAVSVDGAKPETHDAFRGIEGTWHQTIRGVRNLAKAGIPFQIAPCMHKNNWRELPAIVDLARELGAIAVEIFDYVAAGRGSRYTEYELSTEERKQLVDQIIEMQRAEQELTFRVIGLPQHWIAVEEQVPEEEVLLKFVRTCCGAALRYMCILYEGTVYPCMILQIPAGNTRESALDEIWNASSVFRALRDRSLLRGKCGRCKYRDICGGARCKAYAKTGDMLSSDPTCWIAAS